MLSCLKILTFLETFSVYKVCMYVYIYVFNYMLILNLILKIYIQSQKLSIAQ